MASSSGGGGGRPAVDEATALELVRHGSSLLFLGVPQFTLIGIDTQMFSVGPKFKGIKMIPPGPHFVYYCSSNKDGNEFAPTVGFFIITRPTEVVVRQWDCTEERLIRVSEEEEYRYSEAVKHLEFDDHLGPYDLGSYGDWKQLSDHLTQRIIERIEPIGGEISIVYESHLIDTAPKSSKEKRLHDQLIQTKFANVCSSESQQRRCYYTKIPTSVKNRHVTSEKLTALNLDKTTLLEEIISKDYRGDEDQILGELQMCFIAFMLGQSLEAFLQWKALISLLMGCAEAPFQTRTRLFAEFLKVIFHQLKFGFRKDRNSKGSDHIENSLFLDESWYARDVFLYRLCKDFIPLVLEASVVDGDLLKWTRKLKTLLETTLGWDLENGMNDVLEEDEFSPVIVDL